RPVPALARRRRACREVLRGEGRAVSRMRKPDAHLPAVGWTTAAPSRGRTLAQCLLEPAAHHGLPGSPHRCPEPASVRPPRLSLAPTRGPGSATERAVAGGSPGVPGAAPRPARGVAGRGGRSEEPRVGDVWRC